MNNNDYKKYIKYKMKYQNIKLIGEGEISNYEDIKIKVLSIYYKFIFNSTSIENLTTENFIKYDDDDYNIMWIKFLSFYNKLSKSHKTDHINNFKKNICPTIPEYISNNIFIKNMLTLIKCNQQTYYDKFIKLFSFTGLIQKSTQLPTNILENENILEEKIKVLVLEIYHECIIQLYYKSRPNNGYKINYDDDYDTMICKFDGWYQQQMTGGHDIKSLNKVFKKIMTEINKYSFEDLRNNKFINHLYSKFVE